MQMISKPVLSWTTIFNFIDRFEFFRLANCIFYQIFSISLPNSKVIWIRIQLTVNIFRHCIRHSPWGAIWINLLNKLPLYEQNVAKFIFGWIYIKICRIIHCIIVLSNNEVIFWHKPDIWIPTTNGILRKPMRKIWHRSSHQSRAYYFAFCCHLLLISLEELKNVRYFRFTDLETNFGNWIYHKIGQI